MRTWTKQSLNCADDLPIAWLVESLSAHWTFALLDVTSRCLFAVVVVVVCPHRPRWLDQHLTNCNCCSLMSTMIRDFVIAPCLDYLICPICSSNSIESMQTNLTKMDFSSRVLLESVWALVLLTLVDLSPSVGLANAVAVEPIRSECYLQLEPIAMPGCHVLAGAVVVAVEM